MHGQLAQVFQTGHGVRIAVVHLHAGDALDLGERREQLVSRHPRIPAAAVAGEIHPVRATAMQRAGAEEQADAGERHALHDTASLGLQCPNLRTPTPWRSHDAEHDHFRGFARFRAGQAVGDATRQEIPRAGTALRSRVPGQVRHLVRRRRHQPEADRQHRGGGRAQGGAGQVQERPLRGPAGGRLGPGRAVEGPGHRRRLGGSAVLHLCHEPLPHGGRRAAGSVVQRLQRVARRDVQPFAQPARGARADLRAQRRSRGEGARALDEARAARRHDRRRSAGRHRVQRAALREVLGDGGRDRHADQPAYADQHAQGELPLHAGEARRRALPGKPDGGHADDRRDPDEPPPRPASAPEAGAGRSRHRVAAVAAGAPGPRAAALRGPERHPASS